VAMTRFLSLGIALAFLPAGVGISLADDKCTCRAHGRNVEIGNTVCLATAKGFRLATCHVVLNNTSWTISNVPCVTSRFDLQSAKQRIAGLSDDE
jgi:hypothetical protein